ncbi:hypothetical protein LDENG_00197900 [Lucifuga dentata]|nr:hypothetical protein LDENG_00197900 [Lucifuga dentata]
MTSSGKAPIRTKHFYNMQRALLFKKEKPLHHCSLSFHPGTSWFRRLFSLQTPLLLLFPGPLQDLSLPRGSFSSRLISSRFFTMLLKLQLVVLYFKVIASNFISCSKKFLPESAIDVITTSA